MAYTVKEAYDFLSLPKPKGHGYTGAKSKKAMTDFIKSGNIQGVVIANKGALVQSKALGFADGGVVEPSEEAIKKLADLQFLSYKTGVSTAEMTKALNDV